MHSIDLLNIIFVNIYLEIFGFDAWNLIIYEVLDFVNLGWLSRLVILFLTECPVIDSKDVTEPVGEHFLTIVLFLRSVFVLDFTLLSLTFSGSMSLYAFNLFFSN
jgi:hypothetical protein